MAPKTSTTPLPILLGGLVLLIGAAVGVLLLSDEGGERVAPAHLIEDVVDVPRPGPVTPLVDTTEDGPRARPLAAAPVPGEPASDAIALATPSGPSGGIEGRVVDRFDAPVEGVAITLYKGNALMTAGAFPGARTPVDARTVTDAQGAFTLAQIPVGRPYIVVGDHDEFARSETGNLQVVDGQTTTEVVLRMGQGAIVAGTVANDSGQMLPGVRVELFDTLQSALLRPEQRRPWKIALTDDAGRFEFLHVSATNFQVRAESEGYESQTYNVSHALETTPRDEKIDFVLHGGQSMNGQVVDEIGKGIEGARVEAIALRKEYSSNSIAFSDAGGYFLLEGMGTSFYRLHATAVGFTDKIEPKIHISDSEVVVQMSRRGGIQGTVTMLNGNPVTSFELVLMKAHESREPVYMSESRDFEAKDGTFTFDNLDAGSYVLEARAPGFADSRSDVVTLEAAGPAFVPTQIVMGKGGTLTGLVYDPNGKPAPGATVALNENNFVDTPIIAIFAQMAPDKSRKREVATDEAGRFTFTLVTPGVYQVAVKHADFAPRVINDVRVIDDSLGSNAPVELAMPRGAGIAGRAIDDVDRPMRFTKVTITQKNTGFMEATTTDKQGNFEFANLAAGNYTVTVNPERLSDEEKVHPFMALVIAQRSQQDIYLSEGQQGQMTLYLRKN